jgi:hypothetical protein
MEESGSNPDFIGDLQVFEGLGGHESLFLPVGNATLK